MCRLTALAILMTSLGCADEPQPGSATAFAPPVEVGGYYPPVTEQQLRRAEFLYRTGGDIFDFTWAFKDDRFVIEGTGIPQDLITAMLGPDASATRIEGTWRIHDHTIDFAIDDDNDTSKKCSLPVYSTGVIRIQTPDAQYVF